MTRTERLVTVFAGLCWPTSLALPALSFRFDGQQDRILSGWQVLTSGYFHLLTLEFSWLANFVFWFLAWRLWQRPAAWQGNRIASVLLLLLTAQVSEIFIFHRFFGEPRAYAGLWLWVLANLSMAAVGLVASARDGGIRLRGGRVGLR